MAEHAQGVATGQPSWWRLAEWIPHGRTLPAQSWRARHRGILALLWLHLPGLFALGLAMGESVAHMAVEVALLSVFALGAGWPIVPRRSRALLACLGLVSASGMLVHLSGGYIEAHFHYFVMLGVVVLYHDWVPYAVSIGYVLVHHGLVGIVDPSAVYNHAAAFERPWLWAGIHAGFVAALSVANVVSWRATEAANLVRAQAQREQEHAIATLSATLDSTADAILVVDREGRMTHHNQRFVDLWALDHHTIESGENERALAQVLDKLEDPDAFLQRVRELMDDPATESFETLCFRDGRTIERYSRPLRVAGAPAGRVWSFHDVTERERVQQERAEGLVRAQQLRHLREIDEFRTRFINTAAHELNTPLTPMRIQFHLLAAEGEGGLSETQRQALAILKRNFERFDRLVQDVLNGARLQADRLGVERRPLDVGDVVQHAVTSFQPNAQSQGLELHARVEGALQIEGDAGRLAQVLDNLIGNAIKFTPPGGRIVVQARVEEGAAVVRVVDSGAGFSAEQIGRLFQAFSQVHDTSRTRGGSGLGLYICKGIVELHGGRIWCESDGPGRGSTFAVRIPLSPEAAATQGRAVARGSDG